MLKGFKNFIMRGDVVVVAVGLVIALAFSNLVTAFTTNIINPLITRAQGKKPIGLGVQLGSPGNNSTFLNVGALISAIIYFLIFMLVVYFLIVVPYRTIQRRRGITVFGDPPPVKTCPACRWPPLAASTAVSTCPRPPPAPSERSAQSRRPGAHPAGQDRPGAG